ncbi:AraC-like DNA-binding protein [Anaerotaenia torta]|uniref:helix-turn-helix domain-containing protein n=1 Tax=Anaerotaenia torta TaxID=433293 RepID=UPI003D24A24B
MESFDHFSNLFIVYYYGSYIHLDQKWKGFDQSCVYSKFYYITEGECEIKIGDTPYRGIPGRFFYIPAGTRHSFYHINDHYLTKHWVHFKLEAGGEGLDRRYLLPFYVDVEDDTAITDCFEQIYQPCSLLSGELRRNAKLLELFGYYLALSEKEGQITRTGNEDDFNQVLKYIKMDLGRKPTVTELAKLIHVHPNYFIRLFKSKTGMSPGKYMNNLRCETAKSLLENTDIPISRIMLQVGFEDSSAFSHFFHTNTGYSPNEFRKFFGNQK